jgi:predicted nucleic acid-binding protein
MPAQRFLDTNVLVYAYDLDAPTKRATAMSLVQDGWRTPGGTAVSVQVLQELHVNLVRRGRTPEEAARVVSDFGHWPVIENTWPLLVAAMQSQVRWQISLWDALILEAARESGARELYTEDLNHGQDYGGVRVVNPFRAG